MLELKRAADRCRAPGEVHAVECSGSGADLLRLIAARALGGKQSGQHWTMSMTRAVSLGVSLTTTSSVFLFSEMR
jgi:hypothetical protein